LKKKKIWNEVNRIARKAIPADPEASGKKTPSTTHTGVGVGGVPAVPILTLLPAPLHTAGFTHPSEDAKLKTYSYSLPHFTPQSKQPYLGFISDRFLKQFHCYFYSYSTERK
jgi:hypothetical protein